MAPRSSFQHTTPFGLNTSNYEGARTVVVTPSNGIKATDLIRVEQLRAKNTKKERKEGSKDLHDLYYASTKKGTSEAVEPLSTNVLKLGKTIAGLVATQKMFSLGLWLWEKRNAKKESEAAERQHVDTVNKLNDILEALTGKKQERAQAQGDSYLNFERKFKDALKNKATDFFNSRVNPQNQRSQNKNSSTDSNTYTNFRQDISTRIQEIALKKQELKLRAKELALQTRITSRSKRTTSRRVTPEYIPPYRSGFHRNTPTQSNNPSFNQRQTQPQSKSLIGSAIDLAIDNPEVIAELYGLKKAKDFLTKGGSRTIGQGLSQAGTSVLEKGKNFLGSAGNVAESASKGGFLGKLGTGISKFGTTGKVIGGLMLGATAGGATSLFRDKTGNEAYDKANSGKVSEEEATSEAIKKGATSGAISAAGALAPTLLGKGAEAVGIKSASKIAGDTVAKSAGKKIPLIGALIGTGLAAGRAWEGDWTGAGLEMASGLLGGSGIGMAGSIGIDAYLGYRDYKKASDKGLQAKNDREEKTKLAELQKAAKEQEKLQAGLSGEDHLARFKANQEKEFKLGTQIASTSNIKIPSTPAVPLSASAEETYSYLKGLELEKEKTFSMPKVSAYESKTATAQEASREYIFNVNTATINAPNATVNFDEATLRKIITSIKTEMDNIAIAGAAKKGFFESAWDSIKSFFGGTSASNNTSVMPGVSGGSSSSAPSLAPLDVAPGSIPKSMTGTQVQQSSGSSAPSSVSDVKSAGAAQRVLDSVSGGGEYFKSGAYKQGYKLGDIAAQYESGGNAGKVGLIAGDKGGYSYGAFQLASGSGGPEAFLKSKYGQQYASEFQGLGSSSQGGSFKAKWEEIAKRDPEGFKDAQRQYAQAQYLDPLKAQASKFGTDLSSRSQAVQEMFMHAGMAAPAVGKSALKNVAAKYNGDLSKVSDSQLLSDMQTEMMKPGANGQGLAYWSSQRPQIQENVKKAWGRQYEDQKQLLALEQGGKLGSGDQSKQLANTPASSQVATPGSNFVSPLDGRQITSGYGYRGATAGGTSDHKGIDIKYKAGEAFNAAEGGTVSAMGGKGQYKWMEVKTEDGKTMRYTHVNPGQFEVGQKVNAGQQLGTVGEFAQGSHLDFKMKDAKGNYMNPEQYMAQKAAEQGGTYNPQYQQGASNKFAQTEAGKQYIASLQKGKPSQLPEGSKEYAQAGQSVSDASGPPPALANSHSPKSSESINVPTSQKGGNSQLMKDWQAKQQGKPTETQPVQTETAVPTETPVNQKGGNSQLMKDWQAKQQAKSSGSQTSPSAQQTASTKQTEALPITNSRTIQSKVLDKRIQEAEAAGDTVKADKWKQFKALKEQDWAKMDQQNPKAESASQSQATEGATNSQAVTNMAVDKRIQENEAAGNTEKAAKWRQFKEKKQQQAAQSQSSAKAVEESTQSQEATSEEGKFSFSGGGASSEQPGNFNFANADNSGQSYTKAEAHRISAIASAVPMQVPGMGAFSQMKEQIQSQAMTAQQTIANGGFPIPPINIPAPQISMPNMSSGEGSPIRKTTQIGDAGIEFMRSLLGA